MAQDSLSSVTQSIGHAGYLRMVFLDVSFGSPAVSVSFIPTLAAMTHPAPAPLQHVNVAVGGQIHVYQVSPAEPLHWELTFHDLPYFDNDPFQPVPTQGYQSLQSFVRTTLNYHERVCDITTPDGFIETMRYMGGLESFAEAEGVTNRAHRWTGHLLFARVIP